MNFTAIDFETADQKRDSACAVSLVKVRNSKIVERNFYLIKPPRRSFVFSYLHGITYEDVKQAPTFDRIWREILHKLQGSDFLAAHNAAMDKSVLKACCELYGIALPDIEFRCSMKHAREKYDIYPTRLENVVSRLNIRVPEAPYRNAEACANIFLHSNIQQQILIEDTETEVIDSGTRVAVLGSSSAGNATLIWNENEAMFVDLGFIPKYIYNTLDELDVDKKIIKGAVITHLHGDHVKANTIRDFAKNNIPVYIHPVMRKNFLINFRAAPELNEKGLLRDLEENRCKIGNFEIEAFDVPHDSAGGCFGYSIFSGTGVVRKKISIATDVGYTSDFMVEKFKDSDIIVIEANHDIELLENSNRSSFLKNRIKSSGHLSNIECRDFLHEVFKSSQKLPTGVILAHLSQECNTPSIANRIITSLFEKLALNGTELVVSSKNRPTKTLYL